MNFAAGAAYASAATAMTLWYRWPYLTMTAAATPALQRKERDRMVSEKVSAAFEGMIQANQEAWRIWTAAALGQLPAERLVDAPVRIANAAMRPAFRKVRANAKRLHGAALKDALR